MDCNKTVTKSGTPIKLLLGSLFDGSGGFPLGGLLSGITPVWASEIEPFPIRVTTKRLPFMKHYGDISAMDGSKIEPVDIITFGSPCTDMSVAGKRAGLEGHQSVLFYEAIRIIKEMREATNGVYPRFIVWENVLGAFSSNRGEDFKAVLEAIIGVVEPNTEVPMPEKGRWPYADAYMGDGFSVAYRVLDAQFWGVPQRRKRIYLVADFAGRSAFDILFKSEGLSGYSAEGFRSWQRTAGSSADRTGKSSEREYIGFDGYNQSVTGNVSKAITSAASDSDHVPLALQPASCLGATGFDRYNGDLTGEVSSTLGVNCGMSTGRNGIVLNDQTLFQPAESLDCRNIAVNLELSGTLQAKNNGGFSLNYINPVVYGICSKDSNSMKSDNPNSGFYEAKTTRTLDANGGNPACNQGGMAVVALQGSMIGRADKNGPQGSGINADVSFTLDATDRHAVAYGIDRAAFNQGKNAKFAPTFEEELQPTLVAKGPGAIQSGHIVRRLTPTECARLQGFPDWWCDDLGIPEPTDEDIAEWREIFDTRAKALGKETKPKTDAQIRKWLINPHSDSAEYKMWGNGVALPCVFFVLSGIVLCAGGEQQ